MVSLCSAGAVGLPRAWHGQQSACRLIAVGVGQAGPPQGYPGEAVVLQLLVTRVFQAWGWLHLGLPSQSVMLGWGGPHGKPRPRLEAAFFHPLRASLHFAG